MYVYSSTSSSARTLTDEKETFGPWVLKVLWMSVCFTSQRGSSIFLVNLLCGAWLRDLVLKYFIVKIYGNILFIILGISIYHQVEWNLAKRGRKKPGIWSKKSHNMKLETSELWIKFIWSIIYEPGWKGPPLAKLQQRL